MRPWCGPLPSDPITDPCVKITPPIFAEGGLTSGDLGLGTGLGSGLGTVEGRAVGLRYEGVAARVKAAWLAERSKLTHSHAAERTSRIAKAEATCMEYEIVCSEVFLLENNFE